VIFSDFLYPGGYPDVQFGIAEIPIFVKQTNQFFELWKTWTKADLSSCSKHLSTDD